MGKLIGTERFKATDELDVTQLPDGYVIYDEPRQKVHYLNPTAAVVYTICDGTRTIEDVRAFLCDAYDIGTPPDLDELLETLEQAGLVCRVE